MPGLAFNAGGMLVPLGAAVYLILTADQSMEKIRALTTGIIVFAAMRVLSWLLPQDPGYIGFDLDPLFFLSLLAGTLAYVYGRSRRAAFCGAVLGVFFLELASWAQNLAIEVSQAVVTLGGGGVFGAVVLSSSLALLLVELIGEIHERLKRGGNRV